jgi:tetratricopeptide (TPR) repeat protein
MYAQILIKQGTIPANVAVHAIKLAAARKLSLRQLFEAGKLLTDRELNKEQYQQLVLQQEKMLSTEASLGADHLEVALLAQRIADIHLERKDWLAAELMYKRAISVMEKHQTTKGEVARSCERLADIYCQHGKQAEAQPLLFKSLELRRQAGQGEKMESANTLWQLARLELSQFNEATALSFLRSARSIYEKLEPASTPRRLLEQIADCCIQTGITVDLEPVLLQLIDMAHKENRAMEPDMALYAERLGDIFLASARNADALMQFQYAMQIHQTSGNEDKFQSLTAKLAKAAAD